MPPDDATGDVPYPDEDGGSDERMGGRQSIQNIPLLLIEVEIELDVDSSNTVGLGKVSRDNPIQLWEPSVGGQSEKNLKIAIEELAIRRDQLPNGVLRASSHGASQLTGAFPGQDPG